MLLGLIYLIAICTLLVWAVRIIRQRELQEQLAEAQYEARYHRQEAEITLSVSQRILSGFAARVSAVYGQDYQDYLIARQMNLPDVQTPAEPQRPPFKVIRGGQGQTIPSDNRAARHEYEPYESPACWRTPEPPQGYTPPQQWQARAQVPCVDFRQPARLPYALPDDGDVLDVQPVIYPPALLPPTADTAPPIGGGRQRKYASDAERQAAYRERKKQKRGR